MSRSGCEPLARLSERYGFGTTKVTLFGKESIANKTTMPSGRKRVTEETRDIEMGREMVVKD